MTLPRIYLDYNAGAPLRPEARAAVIDALGAGGNASSVHGEGRGARRRIEAARLSVAALCGADPRRVTFVSGGSEANATVLTPDYRVAGQLVRFDRLLVGATEHPSVLAGGRFATEQIETTPVDHEGRVDAAILAARLSALAAAGQSALVSVMAANNETGTLQPVARIGEIVHAAGGLFHCDAAQVAGRLPLDRILLDADIVTLSSHKIGGPQGAGAIIVRDADTGPSPLIRGGRQERGVRAGTENVPAIAGFGAAAGAALDGLTATIARWTGWRDRISAAAMALPSVSLVSGGADRLPQTVCVALDGVSAETLVIGLDLEGIAVSSGSACSSGKVGPSHVLAAMGYPTALARSAVRISFGWETGEKDLDIFESAWQRVVGRILASRNGRAA